MYTFSLPTGVIPVIATSLAIFFTETEALNGALISHTLCNVYDVTIPWRPTGRWCSDGPAGKRRGRSVRWIYLVRQQILVVYALDRLVLE